MEGRQIIQRGKIKLETEGKRASVKCESKEEAKAVAAWLKGMIKEIRKSRKFID
jgi:hypothetical protein